VRVPSPCQFSLVPKQIAGSSPAPTVKLRSRALDGGFVAKSANGSDLQTIVKSDNAVNLLEALCCSNRTILEVNRGRLELLEMAMPEELNRHVLDHLATIRDFSEVLASMPGANEVKVVPLAREGSSLPLRIAVAACVAVVAMSVIAATRERGIVLVRAVTESAPINGVQADDANAIAGLYRWRTAKPEEIDTKFADWLRDSGRLPESKIEFSPVHGRSDRGVAYLLVRDDGARRLIILVDRKPVYDASFSRVDGIALVPTAAFPKLKWGQWQAPTQKPSGDAILLVRDAADPRSGELLFFPNGTLFSGVPKDYSAIDLQHVN
jgi:hypothetical protein